MSPIKPLFLVLLFLLSINFISALDFTPQGNINLRDGTYGLFGASSVNSTGNVTSISGWFNGLFNWTIVSDYFTWDGATLVFNESQLNATIDQRAGDINDSMKNYVDNQNTSQINAMTNQNTSQTNYINFQNTSITNTFSNYFTQAEVTAQNTSQTNFIIDNNDSVNNYILYVNSTNPGGVSVEVDPYWTANYSLFNDSWSSTYNATTNTSITNSIISNNDSMNSFISSQNLTWFTTYNETTNTSINNYISSENTSISNAITSNNASMNSYISSQNESWFTTFNQTTNDSINNNIVSTNNTLASWVDLFFVKFTEIVDQVGNWSADKGDYYTSTQVNAINTSMNNSIYLTTEIDAQNTSQTNAMTDQNTSQINAMLNQNTSQTNYINAQNTSVTNALSDKLDLSGGNMTGMLGINMSAIYELDVNDTIRALNNIVISNSTPSASFRGLGDLYAIGGIKSMEGLFAEAQKYGAGLEIADNDLTVTSTNIMTGTAVFIAATQVIYDPEASFDATYENQFMRLISSTPSLTGATAEITSYINSTAIVISLASAGTDTLIDLTGVSYVIYPHPIFFVGDNGVVSMDIGESDEDEFHVHISNGTGFHGVYIDDVAGADQHQALTIDQDFNGYDGIVGLNIFSEAGDGKEDGDYKQIYLEINEENINSTHLHFIDAKVIGHGVGNTIDLIHLTGDFDHLIHQGSADSIRKAYVEMIDETTNFVTSGAGATLFENNNDYVYIGSEVNFTSIAFSLSTESNKNLNLEYYYCHYNETYLPLSVTDTTDGMQTSGTIAFVNPSDRGTCNQAFNGTAFSNTTEYNYIALKRTQASVQTEPIESLVTVGGSTTLLEINSDMIKIAGSNGGPVTCSASYAGAYYYDDVGIQLLWCDGTDWTPYASAGDVTVHNSLSGLQGGDATERYHINLSTYNQVITYAWDWITSAILNNGTYVTSDADIWDIAGNGTLVEYGFLNNGTYTNTDTINSTAELWAVAANGTLVEISILNNGTYVSEGTTYNSTAELWAVAANGTLVEYGFLDNGTYSEVDTDTFVGNWSDFLTLQAFTTNDTFAQLTVLNNGTYSAVDTDTFVANYSTFLTHIPWSTAANGTLVDVTILNNGTYSAVDTDTFVANYTTFLNKVDWADVGNGTIIVSDTTPQLGGYLDTNGENIGSTSDEIENIYVGDTTRIYFGDGQDASIYWNGSALLIG